MERPKKELRLDCIAHNLYLDWDRNLGRLGITRERIRDYFTEAITRAYLHPDISGSPPKTNLRRTLKRLNRKGKALEVSVERMKAVEEELKKIQKDAKYPLLFNEVYPRVKPYEAEFTYELCFGINKIKQKERDRVKALIRKTKEHLEEKLKGSGIKVTLLTAV